MKYFFLVITLFILCSCTHNKEQANLVQKRTLPIYVLHKESITMYSDYPARIEGKTNVDIRSQIEGYIKKILVEEGSFVRIGQPLFKIDDRLCLEQVNSSKANLAAAQAALLSAKLEVEKQTLLFKNKVNSEFQLRVSKVQYETAKANVAQQKSALKTAKINLDFTLVKAPVSGFLGKIPKRIGNLVSRTDVLTTLSDISEVYAYFSITEKDFLQFNTMYSGRNIFEKISKVSQVSLSLADGSKYSCSGKIQMINGEFDSSTGSISLRAVFKNPQSLLRTGNTGRIVIPHLESGVILVPVLSTLDVQDKIQVVRLNRNNKAERIAITVSGKQGDYYVVKSGLNIGDKIVLKEVESVNDGDFIQPELKK